MRLQGMDPTNFAVEVLERALGQQIGNAMSVNVIQRVLLRALQAANLIPEDTIDEWKSGEAISRLIATVGKAFKSHRARGSLLRSGRRIVAKLGLGHQSRKFIIDSGATYHIPQESELSDEERST